MVAGGIGLFQNHTKWRGQSIQFDGTDDYIDCGDILNSLALPLTIAVRVTPFTAAGVNTGIFATDSAATGNIVGFQIARSTPGLAYWAYGDNTGTGSANIRAGTGSTVLVQYRPYSAAFVVRGQTDSDIYLDGRPETVTYAGSCGAMVHNSAVCTIGRRAYPVTYWNGTIDYVYVYTRALTAVEVAQLAAEPYAMFLAPAARRRFAR